MSFTFAETDLPESRRGREATPLDPDMVEAVRRSYAMDKGKGISTTVHPDEVTKTKGLLRRAADSLGYGISLTDGKVTKTSHTIIFRAKDKNQRAEKPTDIYVVDNSEEGTYSEADADTAGARLASIGEAKALGYTFDFDSNSWQNGGSE